jgi:hypothetical protein
MKKTVWKFGLISGAVVSVALIVGFNLFAGPDGKTPTESGEIFGYTSMIVALSLIFFGIKSYRDGELGGSISFGKAFQIGLLITLVASVMYVVTWMVYYHTTEAGDTFGQQFLAQYAESLREKGMAEAEIAKEMDSQKKFMEVYDSNPLVMFGITLFEIFPIGLLISVIAGLILRTKNKAA